MTCYRPNKAIQGHYLQGYDDDGVVRDWAKPLIIWPSRVDDDGVRHWPSQLPRRAQIYRDRFAVARDINLPCGRCHGCRLDNVRQWSLRMMHHARYSTSNYFVTLTYNDQNLPQHSNLRYDDLSKFFKRGRHEFQTETSSFKYFACGEYGDKTLRPHYHFCAFDFKIDDLRPFKRVDRGWYYTSQTLQEKWPYGHSIVVPLTWSTALYTAGYVTKKMHAQNIRSLPQAPDYDPEIDAPIETYTQQRAFQSHGLGVPFYHEHKQEIWDLDACLFKGQYMVKVPRYYYKLLQREDPERAADVLYKRQQKYADTPPLDAERDRELLYALKVKDLEMQTYVRSL